MDGKSRIVGLNDGIRDLWRWDDGKGANHTLWILFTQTGNEKCSETGSRSTTKRVGQLKSLHAVCSFDLTTDCIEDCLDHIGTLRVVSLGPVVSGSALSKDKVIWTEHLSIRCRADAVDDSWLEVNEDGAWDVSVVERLVKVDVDPLLLDCICADKLSRGIESVFVCDDLPKLGSDLVAALAALNVDDLSHSR